MLPDRRWHGGPAEGSPAWGPKLGSLRAAALCLRSENRLPKPRWGSLGAGLAGKLEDLALWGTRGERRASRRVVSGGPGDEW